MAVSYKYQIIKLRRIENNPGGPPAISGPYFYVTQDHDIPFKDYNNIHSYMIHVPGNDADALASRINLVEIQNFKISNYEIVGARTPIKIFSKGNSMPYSEKFTTVNIPNNFRKIDFTATANTGASSDIYLVLRLNNVKPEEHLKGYFRYETEVIELINTPAERIKKFSFRPRAGAKRLKGVHCTFINPNHVFFSFSFLSSTYYPYTGVPLLLADSPVGRLSMNINNRLSLPLVTNVKDYTWENVTREIEFMEFDEQIIKSATIDGQFIISEQVHPSVPNFTMYLTHKYEI